MNRLITAAELREWAAYEKAVALAFWRALRGEEKEL
jgi:hypothetical protein